MNHLRPAITLAGISLLLSTPALAGPGAVELFDVAAEYNRTTGEIIISANSVESWTLFNSSDGDVFTGPDHPLDAFEAAFGEYERIGEMDWRSVDGLGGFVALRAEHLTHASFGRPISYTDFDLGRVASTGLNAGDFSLRYSAQVTEYSGEVTVVPEPAAPALLAAAAGGLGLLVWRSRRTPRSPRMRCAGLRCLTSLR